MPEIALIDLALPPTGGIDLVRRVRSRTRAAMIVWSLEPSRDAVLGVDHRRARTASCTRRSRRPGSSCAARNGERRAPLSRDMAALMIDAIHTLEERSKARERAAVLSDREKEVSRSSPAARETENRRRAGDLEFTVKRHMQNILQKLDVPSRRAAQRSTSRIPRRGSRRREVGVSERETRCRSRLRCAAPGRGGHGRARRACRSKFIPARQPSSAGS